MIDIKEFSDAIIKEEYNSRFGEDRCIGGFGTIHGYSDEQILDEVNDRGLTADMLDEEFHSLAYKIRNKMNLGQDTKTEVRDLIELLTGRLVV